MPGPGGDTVRVPADVDPVADPYLALPTPEAVRAYYGANGYVVVRGLIPVAECERARKAFAREVKPYRGAIYRQASADPEMNRFSDHGFVLNSILNIQDMNRKAFPSFREAGLAVITPPA